MQKIIKRFLCAVITCVLILSTGTMPALAEDGEKESNAQETVLSDGYYSVPLTVICGTSANPNTEMETFDKYRRALLAVKNGKYKLTLRVATTINEKNEVLKSIKVLKSNYTFDDVVKKTGFIPNIGYRTGGMESGRWDDSTYWDDTITTEINNTYGYTDVTIDMSSLRDSAVLAIPQIKVTDGTVSNPYLYVYSFDYTMLGSKGPQ